MREEQLNSFVIAEAGKCIGCKACELACFAVHNHDNGVAAAVGTVTIPVLPRLYVIRTDSFTMPVQCRQCENAPCAGACPVGAIRQEDSVIVIDEDRCIGCKACAVACPFGAISLYKAYSSGEELEQPRLKEQLSGRLERKAKVIAYKCDLCRNIRLPGIVEAAVPACVSVCPEEALTLVNPVAGAFRSRTAAGMRL